MPQLNYHHLRHFWVLAGHGGLAAAARALFVTPSTVWSQVHQLEESLGAKLFEKQGRRLVLTSLGSEVFELAERVFSVGDRIVELASSRANQRSVVTIGAVSSMPKLLIRQCTEPILRSGALLRVEEGEAVELIEGLARHHLEAVISDSTVPENSPVRAYSHELWSLPLALFAHPIVAARLSKKGLRGLDGAPFLMPAPGSAIRKTLDTLFARVGVTPHVVAEVKDSGLLKTYAEAGHGVFVAPAAVAAELRSMFGLLKVCSLPCSQKYFALTLERSLASPTIQAMVEGSRF